MPLFRRPLTQPTTTVTHPNDPSIKVYIRKPTRVEAFDFRDELDQHQRAVVVYDQENKPAKDDFGNTISRTIFRMPLVMVRRTLQMTVLGWEGLLDENDKPIPFSKDQLDLLNEEWLDVTEEVIVKEKPTKQTQPFGRWIGEQVAKSETWDSDPKTKGSAKQ